MEAAECNAAEKNAKDMARLLIEKGADMNARDDYGRTALMLAPKATAENRFAVDVASLLIEAGADVDAKDDGGKAAGAQ